MAWISGRTISPTSGELVFTINENAQLPGGQVWDQFWQVCEGIEPIIGVHTIEEARYTDEIFQAGTRGRALDNNEHLAEHLEVVELPRAFSDVRPEDIDPMFECKNYRRQVPISIVNFDINDGGDSVIETQGCIGRNCDTIAIYLKTRGKNPTRSILNSYFPNDILRAICWQESRWRHFLSNGKPIFNTNSNGTTDWGLMQINQATFEQQWNWKSNVNRAIALLAEKRSYAQSYLNRHPQNVTAEMIENETIQRYNGGTYYKWNASANAWRARPPNSYVASTRNFMDSKPWMSGINADEAELVT